MGQRDLEAKGVIRPAPCKPAYLYRLAPATAG
jgi:hypothetical protein